MSAATARTSGIVTRRAFLGGTVAVGALLATGACAFGSASDAARGDAGADPIATGRLDPAGGGTYPVVQAGDPPLAHPLDGGFEGFEPLALEEEGGVRVATPFCSVFVPHDMFPGGFTVSYSPDIPEGVWGEGQLRGHDLTVLPATDGPVVHACVTTSNWTGVQGEYVAYSAGPVASDPTFHVVVDGGADYGSDPLGDRARHELYPTYALVSPYIVAARAEDGSWQAVEVERPLPEVSAEGGMTVLAMPGYTVRADPSVWPNGLLYRSYGDEVPIGRWQDGLGVETLGMESDFLALFDPEGPELACWLYAYDGADEDAAGSNNFSVQRRVGTASDGSGRGVYLAVPIRGVTRENYDQLEAFQRTAYDVLERYAACVEAGAA